MISAATQAFIRSAYGILLFGTLAAALPHARRFFLSERWRGYTKSTPAVDLIQNPFVTPLLLLAWFAAAGLLIVGRFTLAAATVNFFLCYYFFISLRWKSNLRGMGAPGFLTYWLAAAVLLLEYTSCCAPSVRPLALLVLRTDFALIILMAGVYKFFAGYPRGEGIELGLANPEWGYAWRHYSKRAPDHLLFKILNQLSWSIEVAAALCLFFPATQFWGALMIFASFLLIATHIRLGLLCEMVMLCCFLYIHPGTGVDRWIADHASIFAPSYNPVFSVPIFFNDALRIFLWVYLVLLPAAYAGLGINFYLKRTLPSAIQRALNAYTNFFAIHLWRVFSSDIVNFFIRIYEQAEDAGAHDRKLLTTFGWRGGWRYSHVGEMIALTTLFTTLKYYPSRPEIFSERLLRYASTVPCVPRSVLVFQYVGILKQQNRFEFVPVSEFTVDVKQGWVLEKKLTERIRVSAAHRLSPIHEGGAPGSYQTLESPG